MGRALRLALMPAILALAAVIAVGASPRAQAEPGVATLRTLQTERTALARALSPAVVAVARSKPRLADLAGPNLMGPRVTAASGFVVDNDYVITCMDTMPLIARRGSEFEFLKPGEDVWLMAHDGAEFKGSVIARDQRNLLILIKMEPGHPELPSLKLGNSDDVRMGATVVGLGNSLDSMVLDGTVNFSYGTVSGSYRFEPIDVMTPSNEATGGDPYKGNVLEVDVAIHPGDHGGPIVNLDGEVVGMINAHFMVGRHLGCAVPSNQIRAVLPQLKKGVAEDELAQGSLGFGVGPDPKGKHPGIFITSVKRGGPADIAGIKANTQLVRVDNYRIPKSDRLKEMLGVGKIVREIPPRGLFGGDAQKLTVSYGVPVGTHIQLTVREPDTGKEKTVDVVVAEKEEDF
jgi:serine protease Do